MKIIDFNITDLSVVILSYGNNEVYFIINMIDIKPNVYYTF